MNKGSVSDPGKLSHTVFILRPWFLPAGFEVHILHACTTYYSYLSHMHRNRQD